MEPAVIVIGGSAGSLDALLAIVTALPDALAIPIVVALHLSPTQPSVLPELLSRMCRRTVREVEDKQALQRAAIHVAPPNYHVLVERGRTLSLSVDAPVHFSRPSIDLLFESAADALGPAVVGVLLSGANEDGARGLRRIRDAGGTAVIQDPATAPHPEMPAAALRWIGDQAHVIPLPALAHRLPTIIGAMASHQDT